jgi:hypothetical protein
MDLPKSKVCRKLMGIHMFTCLIFIQLLVCEATISRKAVHSIVHISILPSSFLIICCQQEDAMIVSADLTSPAKN